MPRSTPTTLTLPPFEGTVRQLVIANIAVYFAMTVLWLIAPGFAEGLLGHLWLRPASIAGGQIWQILTYSFIHVSMLDILISMLMVWMFGSLLETTYGSRFLREVYFVSAIGASVFASVVSFTRLLGLSPESVASGAGSAIFGVMVALAMRMGDTEIRVWFLVNVRIKYLIAIYILIDIAVLLTTSNPFGALLHLSAGFCSYLYVTYAPRRGLGFGLSERYFSLRNSWYRNKRRRAARKFEVYMGKQGRKVSFDKDGHYIDPDEHKDPDDKGWMN